jgi:hypothetical protein
MSQVNNWPAHFCAQCPPSDAEDIVGELFYLAHHPNETEDFDSAKESGLYKTHDECERASLSCWTKPDYLPQIQKMPRHKRKIVMRANFSVGDGKMKDARTHAAEGHKSAWFSASTHAKLPQRFTP